MSRDRWYTSSFGTLTTGYICHVTDGTLPHFERLLLDTCTCHVTDGTLLRLERLLLDICTCHVTDG